MEMMNTKTNSRIREFAREMFLTYAKPVVAGAIMAIMLFVTTH